MAKHLNVNNKIVTLTYKTVACKGCDGTGKTLPLWGSVEVTGEEQSQSMFKSIQGICLGCNGIGTQQVKDKEEHRDT